MGILAQDKNQINLIYDPNSRLGKQALAYAKASGAAIRAINVASEEIGAAAWMEIQEQTGKPFSQLFAMDHPDSPSVDAGSLHPNDWLKILKKHPSILQNPIVSRGDQVIQLDQATDLLKFLEVDSAGLKKPSLGEKPTTDSQTDGESFI